MRAQARQQELSGKRSISLGRSKMQTIANEIITDRFRYSSVSKAKSAIWVKNVKKPSRYHVEISEEAKSTVSGDK
jgi:hypothetical protein